MAKPRLIILIRHAQSEGNKNREIHQTIPDHRVKLTQDGWQQAYDAGRRLRKLLRADDTLHFFTSPYRRTRETTEGILSTLTSDEEDPSPFKRSNIKVYEEPRLREQDFGNFQPCSAEMERMWQERADYGHFFYRIPNGESAADAYDRVSGFNESLWRQFGENDFASVCVLVTHGLMSRVFLMKWYHFTVEYFEDLRNVNHCEFLIMRKQEESGKYILENKLRTWSELRKERAQLKEKEDKERSEEERSTKDAKAGTLLERSKTFIVTRRWGGCPNGCNHKSHYQRRDDLEALRQTDEVTSNGTVGNGHSRRQSPAPRRSVKRCEQGYTSDEGTDGDGRPPQIDVTRARQEVVSSPDGTPSFISAEDRLRSMISPHLHVGRDFGGTYSGHTSIAGSDTDSSEEEGHRPEITTVTKIRIVPNGEITEETNGSINNLASPVTGVATPTTEDEQPDKNDQNGMRRGARANRLGDTHSSDLGSEADEDDLARAEKEDRSIQGSVY
ncbi:phosphoglycerate mutase family domain-containing protein [Colletotrichum tofieldiae]|uniref:Phosphoglycerate mutase family domain-containing protein n=1 Tax=Colletotrichum tofieldiae TaxID=708197 RepID=A0A166RAV0_9PEZI|nr:phosphoglycerate mutase family domain-containing protein [Colletotrichum tofieldiae]GKT57228.1 phosphoglycerate mutase family domain-containing protein [Colletotrichum tofieldiae]GKT78959.1 phosphoglycerate mutase family domain-containing protein [Colletotrichum tofieldiae]